jgi:hypothetical protein
MDVKNMRPPGRHPPAAPLFSPLPTFLPLPYALWAEETGSRF